jgi:hypothetical protein
MADNSPSALPMNHGFIATIDTAALVYLTHNAREVYATLLGSM